MEKSRITSKRRPLSTSLLCDWLTILGVAHTKDFTREKEQTMSFKTWFGLSRTLENYGVESTGYYLPDRSKLLSFPTPFIAHTGGEEGGNIIVTGIKGDKVDYLSMGENKSTSVEKFINACDGHVFLSFPRPGAAEPGIGLHRRLEFFSRSKKWVLFFCTISLMIYAFIANGLFNYVSAYFITAIDLGGIYVTYLLVQKSMNIHNPKADKFCGVLQAGGCDDILATSASKFFGLFGWSEVGFAYFSVSLLALLMFPATLPSLGLCNLCCLPFTVWSIWYQKFRAHRWCTLCVTVQSSLWLLFFAYLAGGWIRKAFPISVDFFVLGFCYVAVMLLINAIMPWIEKKNK